MKHRWSAPARISAALAAALVVAIATTTALALGGLATRDADRTAARAARDAHAVTAVLVAVQDERELNAAADVRPDGPTRLAAARAETDAAVARSRGGSDDPAIARDLLARLDDVRGVVVPARAVEGYSAITGALLDRIADATWVHRLAGLREHLGRRQALIGIGLAARDLPDPELARARDAAALAAERRREFTATAPRDARETYAAAVHDDAIAAVDRIADAVIGRDGRFHPGVAAQQWVEVSQPVADGLRAALTRMTGGVVAAAEARAADSATTARNLVVVPGIALVLAAVAAAVALRRLRASIRSLRSAAVDIAERELPAALLGARDGRVTGARPAMPDLGPDFRGVGAAFDAVVDEALSAAAEQAKLRSGYAEVFVTVFRRSQSLVQRQLHLVQRLEQEEDSPDRLAQLFQLDHLVTRMRRNNENVLVLSGTELVRKSGAPVPVAHLVRAAMSEVEQYQRVEVVDAPRAKVVDTAAGDLIRMLAELLDNATSFSAPETTVTTQAQVLRDGSLSIAVVDNGIGMSDAQVRAANEQLTRLGSLELATSRRVGLLVVGRLAGRRGIAVELLGGDNFPGVTVLVTVPPELVVEAERPGWADRRHALRAAEHRRATRDEATRPPVAPAEHRAGDQVGLRTEVPAGPRAGVPAAQWVENPAGQRVDVVEAAHADVPGELPTRRPNRLVGRAAAKPPAERAASAWFRARDTAARPRAASVAVGLRDRPRNWASVADDGWSVVETVSERDDYTYTEDGLPVRQRGAHLLPGSARGDDERDRDRPVERDPLRTRSRIASFQQGLRRARRGSTTRAGGWQALRDRGDGA
ncbi:sensor histidine kinase [Saccharothrix obliqua]|uniref:sensor histidine kinase n=1 Tax=Saccharothrix obliqua TaxID=2861747 RepID=UPI001C5F5AFA|nr:nitrate- and nitrite sensing domain-containing protein [Saccharothrix obliqua]MBW4718100.1 nitrate- and nitrite sensing domain-containing protein [Saccharothrix obliqua]